MPPTFVYLPDRKTFLNLAHVTRVELTEGQAEAYLREYDAFANSRVKVIVTQTEYDREELLLAVRNLTANANLEALENPEGER